MHLLPSRTRRARAVAVAVVTAAVAALTLTAGPTVTSAGGAIPPVRLGVSPGDPNAPIDGDIHEFERNVMGGAELDAVRLYHAWDELFPQSSEQFLADAGRDTLPVISVKTQRRDGRVVRWVDIAGASYGSTLHSEIVAWARALKAYGRPVVVSLDHEPDFYRNGGSGTAPAYVAAAQRFISILRNHGAANVQHAFIGVAWNFNAASAVDAREFYPGDSFIDWIGVDGYNWGTCRAGAPGWRTAEQVFSAFVSWASSHADERLLIAEFGSVEDWPGRKANWIDELPPLLQRPGWNKVGIVLWWDAVHETDRGCDFQVRSTSSSALAFRRIAGTYPFTA